MGPFVTFTALWGYPYLTGAARLSPTHAGALMAVGVAAMAVAAPLSGLAVTRWPAVRPWLVLATAITLLGVWAGALAWPGGPPPVYLILLVTVIGAGGAVALLAMGMAREDNPGHRSGTATALVNLGGFSAAVISLYAVGAVLDHAGGGYGAQAFRLGFLPVLGLIALGTATLAWQKGAGRSALVAPIAPLGPGGEADENSQQDQRSQDHARQQRDVGMAVRHQAVGERHESRHHGEHRRPPFPRRTSGQDQRTTRVAGPSPS